MADFLKINYSKKLFTPCVVNCHLGPSRKKLVLSSNHFLLIWGKWVLFDILERDQQMLCQELVQALNTSCRRWNNGSVTRIIQCCPRYGTYGLLPFRFPPNLIHHITPYKWMRLVSLHIGIMICLMRLIACLQIECVKWY